MEITATPSGILEVNNARIIYRNFSGEESKFNRKGDRNFALVIPTEEMAEGLKADGWNVKIRPARDEDDTPFMYLPVKVKFTERGPSVYLVSGPNVVKLDEDSVECIDHIDILDVNLDIRPYDWEVNGKEGRTAYLQSIQVIQKIDRFAGLYDETPE